MKNNKKYVIKTVFYIRPTYKAITYFPNNTNKTYNIAISLYITVNVFLQK